LHNALVSFFIGVKMALTKQELETEHPIYTKYKDEWKFFVDSYFGGLQYRQGGYLLKHPFESIANFERREATAYFYNLCQPIVDIYSSYLFKGNNITREFDGLEDDKLFQNFLKDANFEGKSLDQFMREANKWASVYGIIYVFMDKPSVTGLTRAVEIEEDLRPYSYFITPENLINWEYELLENGRTVFSKIVIRDWVSKKITDYRVWTRDSWSIYRVDKDKEGEPVLVRSGDHSLGEIPIVPVINQEGRKNVGLSDINDIADINKNVYYLCSDAKEIIENTAFPMLAVPDKDLGQDSQDKPVGSGQLLGFNKENGEPYWLEAPHSSLAEVREWIKQDIEQIRQIARLGGVMGTEVADQTKSGIAIELETQQLQAVLNEKADNMEEGEIKIFKLWAKWQGLEFTGKITYPEDFSVKDAVNDIDNMLKARMLQISSPTYNKEVQKEAVTLTLDKIDDEKKAEIFTEIETGISETQTTNEQAEELLGEPIEETDGEQGS
jgi:hypothetical protein